MLVAVHAGRFSPLLLYLHTSHTTAPTITPTAALPAHNNTPRTGTWTTRSASTLYAHRSPPDALLRLRSLLSLLLLMMLCLDILNSL